MKKHNRSKISDPLIVPRVKNYLAENVDKTFVDVGQMARSLKERYREYANRGDNSFCQMVEAAYKVVLQSYGLDEGSSSEGSGEDSDDLELLDDGNTLNDRLLTMYKVHDKRAAKKSGDKTSELIDISSDEDSGVAKAKQPKLSEQTSVAEPPAAPPAVAQNTRPAAEPEQPAAAPAVPDRRRKPQVESGKTNSPRKAGRPEPPSPEVTFDDIGGLGGPGGVLQQVGELLLQARHPEVLQRLGAAGAGGALLHGPPGCGKTLLARAIAGRLHVPLVAAPATELVGAMSGESERRVREVFERAAALAPCVLFIDEIDAICGNRVNAQKDMERRIVTQLLNSLDTLAETGAPVLMLAASSRPDALDPALRRAGRLEREIALGIPGRAARRDILRVMARGVALAPDVDLDAVARLTPGYVGADLRALLNKACSSAVKRALRQARPAAPSPVVEACLQPPVNGEMHQEKDKGEDCTDRREESTEERQAAAEEGPGETPAEAAEVTLDKGEILPLEPQIVSEDIKKNEPTPPFDMDDLSLFLEDSEPFTEEQLSTMYVSMEDLTAALKSCRPCAFREGFATVPDTTWEDVGALGEVRRELQLAVLAPVKFPEQLEALGLAVPSGVLLCGPPGCGKTLLAKAVANEAGINFISVKGPELLNMYVGESERAVRTVFQRARNSAPCVIFFDEFDSLCPRRTSGDAGGAVRVVNQLLTEMDGVEGREGVFVLAATNRPDIVDPAVLRPGRLERVLFVGMPRAAERLDILRALTARGRRPQLAPDVELAEVAAAADGYTGADLAGLVRLAATEALTDYIAGRAVPPLLVSAAHFQKGLQRSKPSVSPKEQLHYDKLRLKYASSGEERPDVDMETEEWMDTSPLC